MINDRKTPSLKFIHFVVGIFLGVSILVFVTMGFAVRFQDLRETYTMAEKTTAFLKSECQKYENYLRGNSARSMQELLDKAVNMNKFIPDSELEDSEFLHDYIYTEHMSGVIVLDSDMSIIASADMDGKNTAEMWADTLSRSSISDILKHPQKTYIDHVIIDRAPYDIAAAADSSGSRLVFCYSSTLKPASDPYELTLKSALADCSFYKNPTLVITDGKHEISTNNAVVENIGTDQYSELASTIDWKENWFTKFKYQNTTYYGLRRVYNNYYVYSVYEAGDIFTRGTDVILFAFMLYMLAGIIILAVQRHYDKLSINRMEKQLRIIDAISTSYSSTFLLHMDNLELEPIKVSERLKEVYDRHHNAYDFLFAVCKDELDNEYYSSVMHFLDIDTLAERLKHSDYLVNEARDKNGTWYSIAVIPQKYDENGNIQTLLAATRDITSAKQAEELSFKDKLTGLRNRNYMESRCEKFVREDDLPVSIIMADCNYLKRTNDTLGHEYGDLLLQRVANVIKDSIPSNCVAMRIGGDEFMILCTKCSSEEAHRIADDIKRKFGERSDDRITLSAAFGVSTVTKGEFVFEEAYDAADRDMYRDKKNSRTER